MKNLTHSRQALLALLCGITDPKAMNSALQILLSPSELQDIEHRLEIFQLLAKKMPQREIAARLGVGIATVTRGAAAVKEPNFAHLAELLRKLDSDTSKTDKQS